MKFYGQPIKKMFKKIYSRESNTTVEKPTQKQKRGLIGSPAVRLPLPVQGVLLCYLVGELRSHMPRGQKQET